jgi:hypothetical protein
MKFTRANAATAVALLTRTDEQHESLPAMSEDTSSTDLVRRARIIRRLIKMRAMVQETRNKSAELHDAIERFKDRKAKIANG